MQPDTYPLRARASRMLSASTASGAPARAEGAPAAAQDSRAAAAAALEQTTAQAPALELAPAPGIVSAPQAAFIPAEPVNNSAPAPITEATGSDGISLRASLARMMAAEHRWPAPALATSYAEQSANLAGAPLSLENISPSCIPSPFSEPAARRLANCLWRSRFALAAMAATRTRRCVPRLRRAKCLRPHFLLRSCRPR